MNIINTAHPTVRSIPTPSPVSSGGGSTGTADAVAAALTVTAAPAETSVGEVPADEEVERSLVRDDWLGRAMSRAFCYNAPAIPKFADETTM